ncbi:hypothetical protein ACXR6G_04325 [Ancylomarina sp. YFZ004]
MRLISAIIDNYRRNGLINRYYYSKYYYYSRLIEYYTDLSEYSRIIDLYKKKELSTTNKIIAFQEGYLFNQKNKKHILKKFKYPQFKYRIRKNNLDIEIYFYKIIIGGHKVRLEIHLSDNKLFYYNYTFTRNLNNQQLRDIIRIIQEKYLDGLSIDICTQSIIDQNQTVLDIENTMELKIHYIYTNSNIIQSLNIYKETSANKKVKSIEKKLTELRNKL